MIVIFMHGWGVTDTTCYGEMPAWLASQSGIDGKPMHVEDLHLGKYITFDDAVRLDDIARAFEFAIRHILGPRLSLGERFAVITHSTGGPVLRTWVQHFYAQDLPACPMSHLVMLAPANHGSALAQLGKGRLNRIRSALKHIEPGQEVLNWLELGSEDAWTLNRTWMRLDCVAAGVFPFVLTGQGIDRSLYDALNSYTGEPGSDGVVRVASANLNYAHLRLTQDGGDEPHFELSRTPPTAFGVLPNLSHSGSAMGVLGSVTHANGNTHPTAQWVLKCLRVTSAQTYAALAHELAEVTADTQTSDRLGEKPQNLVRFLIPRTFRIPRFTMLVFRVVDDRGHTLQDYDLLLTAGPEYDENHLPEGFFQDRQRNQRHPGTLTYYLNHDVLDDALRHTALEGCFGFRLIPRPGHSLDKPKLVFYNPMVFRGSASQTQALLQPNETVLVDIQVKRHVDAAVCQIERTIQPSTIDPTPRGTPLP